MINESNPQLTQIRTWLGAKKPENANVGLDVDLIENRLIDSLDFMDLIFLLEEVTEREVPMSEVSVDKLRTLRSIQEHFLS